MSRSCKRGRVLMGFVLSSATGTAYGAPCSETNLPNPVYGAGSEAITPLFSELAGGLASLPESERFTLYYSDPGACAGFAQLVEADAEQVSFKYWDEAGLEHTCEAPGSNVEFAFAWFSPKRCAEELEVPSDVGQLPALVHSLSVITNYQSTERTISAEALYHILGFGAGAPGRAVAPWTELSAVFAPQESSFVSQLLALAVRVPVGSFKIPPENFVGARVVSGVFSWGQAEDELPEQSLGVVAASSARMGEEDEMVRTLAYQHFDQSCAYLPDSQPDARDRKNIRAGQYALWTNSSFYARVGEDGRPTNPAVRALVGWFDGSIEEPKGVEVRSAVAIAGDIPLCAMQALRAEGDFSGIQSYAPPRPCNGWYESELVGSTDYEPCEATEDCGQAGQACRFGYCEAY